MNRSDNSKATALVFPAWRSTHRVVFSPPAASTLLGDCSTWKSTTKSSSKKVIARPSLISTSSATAHLHSLG